MKVLVAEDDPVVQQLLNEILSDWHYQVLLAEDGLQALQIAEDNPDLQLFIVDWSIPWLDGLSLCKKVKQTMRSAYFIMLSSRSGTDDLVMAMEEGVDDFIAKPFIAAELRVRMRVGKRILDQERRLLHIAHHDELTGILNRRNLLQVLDAEWARTQRDSAGFAVMFCDLDHFKRINDQYGHVTGDEVLKHFCSTVSRKLRPYDQFGRYGGEEFMLILPNTDKAGAMCVATRILDDVRSRPLQLECGRRLPYTVSAGIAIREKDEVNVTSLIKRADQATYQAKACGRDQVVYLSR